MSNIGKRFSFENETGHKHEYVNFSLEDAKKEFIKDKLREPDNGKFDNPHIIKEKPSNKIME